MGRRPELPGCEASDGWLVGAISMIPLLFTQVPPPWSLRNTLFENCVPIQILLGLLGSMVRLKTGMPSPDGPTRVVAEAACWREANLPRHPRF